MQRHLSRYVIVSSSRFQRPGQAVGDPACRLLYDGRDGGLAMVPEQEVEAATAPDGQHGPPRLSAARLLVDDGVDELEALVHRNARAASEGRQLDLTIAVSSGCNMGCDYCGQTHGPAGLGTLEFEALAGRRFRSILAGDGSAQRVRVHWFGGEPLLAYPSLVRLSRRFVRHARERGIAYSAKVITNGVLLDAERIEDLHTEMHVEDIEVTLDGPGPVHDRRRRLKAADHGSYDHIVGVLARSVADEDRSSPRFVVRVNVDVRNADDVDALLDDLAARGLAHPRVRVELHPVYSWSNDVSAIALRPEDFAGYELRWLWRMAGLGLRCMVVPSSPRPIVCSAVAPGDEVISRTGNVFSCTEHPLVGRHEQDDSLFHLRDAPEGPRPAGPFDGWIDRVRGGEVPCATCPLYGVCGGACPKHWEEGDPPCPSFKYNLDGRLELAAVQAGWVPC